MTEPTPADRAAILAAVERDTLTGFADRLSGLRFDLAPPLDALGGALVDGSFGVVAWHLRGVDDLDGFNHMWPTAKEVLVHGVTIVATGTDPWTFHRQVDWNGLNAQLGGSGGRASSPLLVKSSEEARFFAALHFE